MTTFQSFMEKMGSNFLVASIIPSLAFVISADLFFIHLLPPNVKNLFGDSLNPLSSTGLFSLVVTIILGFTLTSLNTFILKVLEGYVLIHHLPFFRQSQLRAMKRLQKKIKRKSNQLEYLMAQDQISIQAQINRLRDQCNGLVTLKDSQYPSRDADVMPTRFGNILKAAEEYPMSRYQIDSVPMWPRLIHVIPPSYDAKIENSHNQLSFLVNCAVLSFFFALCSGGAALYQLLLPWLTAHIQWAGFFPPATEVSTVKWALFYFIIALISLGLVVIFYKASLFSVGEFGSMIRSAYDLFRFDLLKQLHFSLPEDIDFEEDQWQDITEFMNKGRNRPGEVPLDLSYLHSEDK